MSHKEIQEKIPLLIIGKLNEVDKWEVENHLEGCPECQRIYLMEKLLRRSISESFSDSWRRAFYRGISYFLSFVLAMSMIVGFWERKSFEVVGIDDIWEGYVIVNSGGYIKVQIFIDGNKVKEKSGFGSVFFDLKDLDDDVYHIQLKVYDGNRTYIYQRIVEKINLAKLVNRP